MLSRNFTAFPTLTTERLTLRQLSIADQQNIFALRSDNEINKYLEREPCKRIEDAIVFINKILDNNNSVYWVITLENKFVGTICLYNFSDEMNSCEIGFELMTKFQGMGIMREAIEKVIDFAFNTMQFQNIIAETHKENLRSIKLLKKYEFFQSIESGNKLAAINTFILTNYK